MDNEYWTIGDASKHTGRSKTTISKYLQNGSMSYLDKNKHSYKLDPAEVLRVFPRKTSANSTTGQTLTPEKGNGQWGYEEKIQLLTERIAQIEADRERERKLLEGQLEDVKHDRDQWRLQARNLIEDKRQKDNIDAKAEIKAAGWLRKWFG